MKHKILKDTKWDKYLYYLGDGGGGTHVPDMTFILIQVFVNFVHQNGEICARKGILVPDNGTDQLLVKFYPIYL